MARLAFAALALLATAAVAKTYAPKCRPEGEKCKGADYKPEVEWIDCCDGMSCDTPAKDWGYVCGHPHKKEKHGYKPEEPKCRPAGERCIGAEGYPAVDWIPCCDDLPCEKPDKKYGLVCGEAPKKYAPPAPKCRPAGERCIGAEGYPAVDWIPCCDYLPCEKPDKKYGYVCGEAPKTKAPKTTKPKVTKPKCLAKDKQCGDGYMKCCDGYYCDAATDTYGYATCQPKCTAEKGECGKGYDACCEGYECVKEDYGDKMVCMAPPKY